MNNNFILGEQKKEVVFEKERVNFTDVHDRLASYKLGLITKEDAEKWLNEVLEVKSYMSIEEKFAVINIFRQNFEVDFLVFENGYKTLEKEFILMQFVMRLFFDVMLHYTNISVLDKYKTPENYDLVVSSGFYEMIYNICKKDYKILEKYCKEALDLNNNSLSKMLETLILSAPSPEDAEKVRDMLNDIDEEKLKILESVQKFNNPYLDELLKTAAQDVIKPEIESTGNPS